MASNGKKFILVFMKIHENPSLISVYNNLSILEFGDGGTETKTEL
jgi:hypothetical protein